MNTQEATKSVTLLKENKANMVAAFHALTNVAEEFAAVTIDTPAGEFADLMQWAGGLLDVKVAAEQKSDHEVVYMDAADWAALSTSQKSNYYLLGVRLRAEGQKFIVAPYEQSQKWCSANVGVPGLANFGEGNTGVFRDVDGYANTQKILTYDDSTTTYTFPAAEACRDYVSQNINGSRAEYFLGSIVQIIMLYKYRSVLNTALNTIGATPLTTGNSSYWSSTQYSSASAWVMNFQAGYMYSFNNKTYSYVVRPLAKC